MHIQTNRRTSLRLLMEGKETESTSVSLSIISACCSFSPSSQGGYGAGNLVLFENSDKEILSPHVNWNIRKVIHRVFS